MESDRIAKREVAEYAAIPTATIIHEAVVMPEHETMRHVLKLEQEKDDAQMDGLLKIVAERGIRNALSVCSRLKNSHLEDDFHRVLVRYIAEGLPDKGFPLPEKVKRALHMVLFEIHPQVHGEKDKEQGQKLERILSSSEQLYAGLLSLVSPHEGFSLEMAVAGGTEEASLYLAVPRIKQTLAERLISSVFPNARILECRDDYNIFNPKGENVAAVASLANHPALPLKTYESFEHDPLNVLLASFAKIAKHGEGAALQLVVGNEGDRYNKHYKKILRQIEKGQSLLQALNAPETTLGDFVHEIGKVIFGQKGDKNDDREKSWRKPNQSTKAEINRKVEGRITPVVIRLVASAEDKKRAKEILNALTGSFQQYENPNGNRLVFKEIGRWSIKSFLRDFIYRSFNPGMAIPLSLSELATIYRLKIYRNS